MAFTFNPFSNTLDYYQSGSTGFVNNTTSYANYTALIAAGVSANTLNYVIASQGTSWLPGSLGGTYYPNGWYFFDGVNYTPQATPFNASQTTVNTGTNNDQFVTPLTLTNSSQLAAKQNTLTNPITGTGVSGQSAIFNGVNTISGFANNLYDGTTKTLGLTTAGANLNIVSTLGTEQMPALTTGNWTMGTGWRYLTGPNSLDKNVDSTGTVTPTATTTIVAGTRYKVVIVVSSISASSCTFTLGGNPSQFVLSSATTYTDYITAGTTGNLIITPTATTARINITSISVIPITGNGVLNIDGNIVSKGWIGFGNIIPLSPLHIPNVYNNATARLGDWNIQSDLQVSMISPNSYFDGTNYKSTKNAAGWQFFNTTAGGIQIRTFPAAPVGGNITGTTYFNLFNNGKINIGATVIAAQFGLDLNTDLRIVGTFKQYFGGTVTSAVDYTHSIVGGAVTLGIKPRVDDVAAIQFQNAAGTAIVTIDSTNAYEKVDGNIVLPKTTNKGMMVDTTVPTFPWKDLLGIVVPRAVAPNAATLSTFRGGQIREWAFAAGDRGDNRFHIPHDYLPGSDMFIHVHWAHNGTAISGNAVMNFYISYAKGFNQAAFTAEKNVSITYNTTNIATTPQYQHRIDEVQISSNGGSATLLDSATLEVDGVILVNFDFTTIPTITGGSPNNPFVFFIDIHYQSTGVGTKAKAPNFYV